MTLVEQELQQAPVAGDGDGDGDGQSGFQPKDLIWVLVVVGIILAGQFSPYKPVSDFFGGFGWLTKQALNITRDLFESYGYLTIFFAPLLENTLFIGALIPGNLVMLLAGISANDGLIDYWPAIVIGTAGAMIGDTISYGMGRFAWHRFGPDSRFGRWADRMREPLLNHSVWLVFTYHFAGYSRMIGPAASGFLRMPFLRWMLLDYIGVAVWVFVYVTAGYLLGAAGIISLDDSDKNIRIFEIILFGFFALAALSVIHRAGKKTEDTTPAPSGGEESRA